MFCRLDRDHHHQHYHFPSSYSADNNMEDTEAVKAAATHGGSLISISTKNNNNKKLGGFRASSFIFALTSLESMGFVANMVSLVLYFMSVMCLNLINSSNTLTNFMGSAFLLSLLGGFISDAYISRLNTSIIFGSIEVLALAMMTIQAYYRKLEPESCLTVGKPVSGGNAVYFYVTLGLMALGVGGVKGALPALGADQFNKKDLTEAKALATFFNFLVLSTTIGASIGVTAIVWVNMNKGWYWGFFISTIATFIGFVILAIGKPFYRPQSLADSPIIRIAQVVTLAFKNRSLPLPESPSVLFDSTQKEERIAHTDQFRFLDKAAILPKDAKPWTVCTVTQVEEVKILTRMLPILASTILLNTCMAQLQTFSVHQGSMMDASLGALKAIPTPSIPFIPLFFMSVLLPLYEFFFVPFARKITGHPSGITQLQRIGVGLVLCAVSMAVAGAVEVKRRDNANRGIKISLFWLSFQYGIFGIADMFSLIGLLEFFYREAPAGMRSLSTSFTWLSLSFGYFLSTVLVNVINSVTEKVAPSKHGWLYGLDLNTNNLDLVYWFLAILSTINFVMYLLVASWYKYKTEEDHQPEHKAEKEKVYYSGLTPSDIIIKPLVVKDNEDDASSKPELESSKPNNEDNIVKPPVGSTKEEIASVE